MSSFWNTSDNTQVEATTSMEVGGAEPMPSGTAAICVIDSIEWKEWEGDEYINVRWCVVQHPDFQDRKVFHKIRVMDADKKKRDKALKMLATLDNITGAKLMQGGERPDDIALGRMMNKPVHVTFDVWEIEGRSGNWVRAVAATGAAPAKAEAEGELPWGG